VCSTLLYPLAKIPPPPPEKKPQYEYPNKKYGNIHI
jgi:hypothetical protein